MQHTVNHGCRLGSCDVLVWLKGAVCIALYPAQRGRTSDFIFRPMSGDIVKITLYLDIASVETRANCRKFRSCDGCIRHKGIRCAPFQNTDICHCGNGFIMPQSKRHIVKSILCRKNTAAVIKCLIPGDFAAVHFKGGRLSGKQCTTAACIGIVRNINPCTITALTGCLVGAVVGDRAAVHDHR